MRIEDHIYESQPFAELIEDAVAFMLSTPLEELPPTERFVGGGIYALYYGGKFPQYREIYRSNPQVPIYVGKAVLPGWRQGRGRTNENDSALFRRLNEHGRSIDAAENLQLEDFSCRFILLQDQVADLIPTVEAAMTRRFNPLWNSQIDGFGNHDPGKGRYEQAKSEWDLLHPGRVWADRLKGTPPDKNSIEEAPGGYYVSLSA